MNAPRPPISTRDRAQLRQRQETHRDPRGDDDHRDLARLRGIVGVLWIGARDVRAEAMSVGELIQFLIYAIMVGGSVGALSEIWGELQRASGATERLVELLNIEDTVQDPASGRALPQGGRGAIASRMSCSTTRRGPKAMRSTG
jgi:ABC-type multidrug transport system fused ATPase/permease subunit